MKVSVIMNTVGERQDYLSLAIESYLDQKGCEVELIISTITGDVNINFVKEKYPQVKIITMDKLCEKSPKGSFLQLNNAFPHITGDWFTFASSNDIAIQTKLIQEVEMCLNNGKKEVCYSSFHLIDEIGNLIRTQLFFPYNYDKHLIGNFVSDCALISKRLVDEYLPFKVDLNNYAYWDLWLRIYEGEGNVFIYNKTPTWGYRQIETSMHIDRQKSELKLAEAKRDKEIMLNLHR